MDNLQRYNRYYAKTLIQLAIILFLFLTHTTLFSQTPTFSTSNVEAPPETLQKFIVTETVNLADLLVILDVSFDELNHLNQNKLSKVHQLRPYDELNIPSHINMKDVKEALNRSDDNKNSKLPELQSQISDNRLNLQHHLLINTPLNSLYKGSTDENIAQSIQFFETQAWENLSAQRLIDEEIKLLANQLKNSIHQNLTKQTQSLLGRFGKAEVNLQIDDKDGFSGSSFHLFSPLYDTSSSLVFSQMGVHQQGSDDSKRLIGNLGFGYRYDEPAYLLGANAFIDHDFDYSHTRLGFGLEYWQENYKLAGNYYMPLSDWKTSEVMQAYDTLIYDERPARGFDIRMKGYLPDYPKLGALMTFEQYYGEEVDLFSIEQRKTSPFAVTFGLDYTPFPLMTHTLSYKIGEQNHSDLRFDLQLNLQLGTDIESQINPDNVAIAKSLKGSRYDKVDRNYDIVFEYRKEEFAITLEGTKFAELNDLIKISAFVNTRAPVVNYKWIISTDFEGLNVIKTFENSDAVANQETLQFIMDIARTLYVRVEVTTQRGYRGVSKPHMVEFLGSDVVASLHLAYPKEENVEAYVLASNKAFSLIDFNRIDNKNKSQLTFKVSLKNDITQKTSKGLLPLEIYWRDISSGSSLSKAWIHKEDEALSKHIFFNIQPVSTNEENIPNASEGHLTSSYILSVVALEEFLGEQPFRTIDIKVADPNTGLEDTLFKEASEFKETITFKNILSTALPFSPDNFLIDIYEVSNNASFMPLAMDDTQNLVSRSGVKAGTLLSIQFGQIQPATTYKARICTEISEDQLNQEEEKNNEPNECPYGWQDITQKYEKSIVWLYWDPLNQQEVSAENAYGLTLNYKNLDNKKNIRRYRALEACNGSNQFTTQANNYTFNELSWGDIHNDAKIVAFSEQSMRLAVQFDFLADDTHIDSTSKQITCEPSQSTMPAINYIGLNPQRGKKAAQWITVDDKAKDIDE